MPHEEGGTEAKIKLMAEPVALDKIIGSDEGDTELEVQKNGPT